MEAIKDLVSVIIPTYNRAHLIKRSAMSVLNQTYSNLELIIVDDGSTDNTEEVVKSLDDERVIYIKQSNQGACAARNNGIDHAKGEFIAFQDSDDVWHLDKLEKQIKCLKETGADVVVCNLVKYINGKRFIPYRRFIKQGFLDCNLIPYGICPQMICGYTIIFKKNKFDNEMPRFQDFELFIRLFKEYSFFYEDIALVDYCLQDDSISKNNMKLLKAWNIILTKHLDFYDRYKKFLPFLANFTLRQALEEKDDNCKNLMINLAFNFSKDFDFKTRLKYLLDKIYLLRFFKFIFHLIH